MAQGRGGAINWATRISHAELMRLKCVGRQRRGEGIADHTNSRQTHSHAVPQHTGTTGASRAYLTDGRGNERKEESQNVS